MAASRVGFPSPIKKLKPPVFFFSGAPRGRRLCLPHPSSQCFSYTWLIPGESCQDQITDQCHTHSHSNKTTLQLGPPPIHSGTYRLTQSRLCPTTPSAGLTTTEAHCFPPINVLLCSASTWQRDACSLPASPPFMLPSHRANLQ